MKSGNFILHIKKVNESACILWMQTMMHAAQEVALQAGGVFDGDLDASHAVMVVAASAVAVAIVVAAAAINSGGKK